MKSAKIKRILIGTLVAVVALLAAGVAVFFLSFATIEPVSRREAVEIFQEEQKAADSQSDLPSEGRTGKGRSGASGKRARPGVVGTSPKDVSLHSLDKPNLPAPGTYFFQTDGYEQVGGFKRRFPEESSRIVTRHGSNRWRVHHIFSDDHQQWIEYSLETDRQLMHSRRVKAFFTGPFELSANFEPPIVSFPFPFKEGNTWSGSWKGDVSGTYEGLTIGLENMSVGGRTYRVWHNRFHAVNSGSIEGELTTDLWVSPELGIYTKEKTRVVQRAGPFEYVSEYVMTLKSTVPKTTN